MDRTAKLYIGGKQARPDSGYSTAVFAKSRKLVGHASNASHKDVRNAVEAANTAKGWSKTTGHLRAQILYFIAENLSARAEEFADRLNTLQGGNGGQKEVEAFISRLFTYAAWADKYDGQVHGVPMRGTALAMKEPVGVIAALCPDHCTFAWPDIAHGPRHRDGQPSDPECTRGVSIGRHGLLPSTRHLRRARWCR